MFEDYLKRWQLEPDGKAITTHSSDLVPVLYRGTPAILKIAHTREEQRGSQLMEWWKGKGAARVLKTDETAILLERATSGRSLSVMAREGEDDEATRILCACIAALHGINDSPPLFLLPLENWFSALTGNTPAIAILNEAKQTALDLLSCQQDIRVLHGDIHHGNVLDFEERGWLAIDPKALIGDRYFDYANILCNPDYETAFERGRFQRQLDVIVECAQLDRGTFLQWVLAYCGLSASWSMESGQSAEGALAIAEMARELLAQQPSRGGANTQAW